jgi:hypothetical protein
MDQHFKGVDGMPGARLPSSSPLSLLRRQQPADLRAFMRSCMYNAAEKLEDAVAILTSRYYNNMTYNSKDSDSIAAYYAADAVSSAALHA